MTGKKFGADERGKTFGPGHDGWYVVAPLLRNVCIYKKAKSAYSAAAQAGYNLTQCRCHPVTDQEYEDHLKDTK